MRDILQNIIANKRVEVDRHKQAVSLNTLLALGSERLDRPTISMRSRLESSSSGIIAEFKRKSPSKGWLHPKAEVSDVLPAYEAAGACACSVLTDGDFFGGALGDLHKARHLVKLPLLRKDFVIDEYQLYQARVMGADAVLLIAAVLNPRECEELAEMAHILGMEVLLEVHSEEELDHLNKFVDMLGVNNRNLGSFHTSVENSFRLAEKLKEVGEKKGVNPLLISESGLKDAEMLLRLREVGFRGFLIGETFMREEYPGDILANLIKEMEDGDR